MVKLNKAKKLLIVVLAAVSMLAGGLLGIFLAPTSHTNLSTVFANVGDEIEGNNNNLVKSYNSQLDEEEMGGGSQPASVVKSLSGVKVLSSESDEVKYSSGKDTFSSYLFDINNIMGYYAISEYLNEHLQPLRLNTTYYYDSTTVKYYALARQTNNSFSFKLHNDYEDIEVTVNYDKGAQPKSVEFMQRNTYNGDYYYFSAVIDFEKDTYVQTSLRSDDDSISHNHDRGHIKKHVKEYSYYFVDYNDFSKFDGYNIKNMKEGNAKDAHLDIMHGQLDRHGNFKDFKDFGRGFNKKGAVAFPSAEDLQVYAFNKYSVTIEKDHKGRQKLVTSQRKGMNDLLYQAATTFNSVELPEHFEQVDFTYQDENLKTTVADLRPELSSISENIKYWFEKEYNKDEYYFKTMEYDEFQLLITANRFIYAQLFEDYNAILSIKSFDMAWVAEYFYADENGTKVFRLAYDLSVYGDETGKYNMDKYTTSYETYNLRLNQIDDDVEYQILSYDEMSFATIGEKDKIYKLQYQTLKMNGGDTLDGHIIYYSTDGQTVVPFSQTFSEDVCNEFSALIEKVKSNTAQEDSGYSMTAFFVGDLSINIWRTKLGWSVLGSSSIKTLNVKFFQNGNMIFEGKPLRNSIKHAWVPGSAEIEIKYIIGELEKTAYAKLSIDNRLQWDSFKMVDHNATYIKDHAAMSFKASENTVFWQAKTGVEIISQYADAFGTEVGILNNTFDVTPFIPSFDEYKSNQNKYGQGVTIMIKYNSNSLEQTLKVKLSYSVTEYYLPVQKIEFRDVSIAFEENPSIFTINILPASYTFFESSISITNFGSDALTEHKLYFKENTISCEFDEQNFVCDLPLSGIESVACENKAGLYKIVSKKNKDGEELLYEIIYEVEQNLFSKDIVVIEYEAALENKDISANFIKTNDHKMELSWELSEQKTNPSLISCEVRRVGDTGEQESFSQDLNEGSTSVTIDMTGYFSYTVEIGFVFKDVALTLYATCEMYLVSWKTAQV